MAPPIQSDLCDVADLAVYRLSNQSNIRHKYAAGGLSWQLNRREKPDNTSLFPVICVILQL